MGLIGLTIGYLAGLVCGNDDQARNLVTMYQIICTLTMGVVSNVSANFFTRYVSYINPMRYAAEIYLRSISNNKKITIPGAGVFDMKTIILDQLDFKFGLKVCYTFMGSFYVFLVILCSLVIHFKNRR